MRTKNFNRILIENNVPNVIDYLSLDTEGTELDILRLLILKNTNLDI